MTLDAGGTNFVFSALRGCREVIDPIFLPSDAHNLEACLSNIVNGFNAVKSRLTEKPVAISFAFPGEADYPEGIIGDLLNLPAFRGGVALGPMLEEKFKIPVYINNDGDLFTYGEAVAGLLTEVNSQLEKSGSRKRYKNLLGVTLGTGFGGGLTINNEMFLGDNSAGVEVWALRNRKYPDTFAEEGASIRAVKRVYSARSKAEPDPSLSPKDIYNIACGTMQGDKQAALEAFTELGVIVGDALANALTIVDSLVVIGGGLAGAYTLFLPAIVAELNSKFTALSCEPVNRLEVKAFNLEDENELGEFLTGKTRELIVPGTRKKILYDPVKRTGIGISRLGTNKSVFTGAYIFALRELDNQLNVL